MKKETPNLTVLNSLLCDAESNVETSTKTDTKNNPKFCRISLFENDQEEEISLLTTETQPNAITYRIKKIVPNDLPSQEEYQLRISKIINDHVQKYGTIDEIRFVGHGSREWVYSQRMAPGYKEISTDSILANLSKLENESHVKMARRIVFDACQTFVGLDDEEIEYYREYAKKHNVAIVGTTSNTETLHIFGLHIRVGRYVQFSPSGNIIWDALDAPYKTCLLNTDSDRSWTDNYVNRNFEQDRIRKKPEVQQR
jgi:hypothetical protein